MIKFLIPLMLAVLPLIAQDYTIDQITDSGEKLVAQDGSEWKIKWWFHPSVIQWQPNEHIKFKAQRTYLGYDGLVRIENTDRNEVVESYLLKEPEATNPHALWITKMEEDVITLNNGNSFVMYPPELLWLSAYFEVGDLITIMEDYNGHYQYILYNHSKKDVLPVKE